MSISNVKYSDCKSFAFPPWVAKYSVRTKVRLSLRYIHITLPPPYSPCDRQVVMVTESPCPSCRCSFGASFPSAAGEGAGASCTQRWLLLLYLAAGLHAMQVNETNVFLKWNSLSITLVTVLPTIGQSTRTFPASKQEQKQQTSENLHRFQNGHVSTLQKYTWFKTQPQEQTYSLDQSNDSKVQQLTRFKMSQILRQNFFLL